MAKSAADRHKGLKEIADQLRSCDDEGPKLAGVCVPLLARARKLAAFEGERYAKVRTALDRWREHKKNAVFWDEVVGTVRLEGQNDPHAPHVITFQRVVSALWPDLADYVEDTITIGGKARPHHTGKCDVHLWCQWREAKDRLAELIESIAGSKPGGAATDQVAQAAKPPKTITEPPAPPAKLLASWGEILEALGLKKKDRNKVARLNRTRGGPIKPGKKGQQPIVDHAELLEWWNRLTIEYEVGENRRRDAKPTAAASHEHGRDGVVLPDIGGSERKRRADRKP